VRRRSGGPDPIVGGSADIDPPRAISRRRQTVERMARLVEAVASGTAQRLGSPGSTCTERPSPKAQSRSPPM
jgi:hypothetical protein